MHRERPRGRRARPCRPRLLPRMVERQPRIILCALPRDLRGGRAAVRLSGAGTVQAIVGREPAGAGSLHALASARRPDGTGVDGPGLDAGATVVSSNAADGLCAIVAEMKGPTRGA